MTSAKAGISLALAAVLTLSLFPTGAGAAQPRLGVYDCIGVHSGYVASVRIKSGGDYLYANSRNGKVLKNPSKGRYRASGRTIRWRSGTFRRAGYVSTMYTSASRPKGYFSLDRKSNGTWTGISCYWEVR
jgi:hypothetical protein